MPNSDRETRFLLPHEDPDEYREFLAGLNDAHQPRDAHERMLVQELADASWAWQRARANDREFWGYIGGHYKRGNAGIAEAMAQEKEARFRVHLRHMGQCERQYYRALTAVERMHRNRGRGQQVPASRETTSAERALAATAEPAAAEPQAAASSPRVAAFDSCAILNLHDRPRLAPSPSPPCAATGSFLIQDFGKCNQSPPLTTAGFSFSNHATRLHQTRRPPPRSHPGRKNGPRPHGRLYE